VKKLQRRRRLVRVDRVMLWGSFEVLASRLKAEGAAMATPLACLLWMGSRSERTEASLQKLRGWYVAWASRWQDALAMTSLEAEWVVAKLEQMGLVAGVALSSWPFVPPQSFAPPSTLEIASSCQSNYFSIKCWRQRPVGRNYQKLTSVPGSV
jgi:hypothetical protein